jgi:hypothetical protein
MMVNIFSGQLKQSLAGFEVETKSGEATVLATHLEILFDSYPGLKLLTGDAHYAGRNLCQAIVDLQRDYLVTVKANAGDLYEAIDLEFRSQRDESPAAKEVDKKGGL